MTTLATIGAAHAAAPLATPLPPATVQALHRAIAVPVTAGAASGLILLLGQGEQVVFDQATGHAGPPPAPALRTDAIFWIASMSKPITATAIMMLADQGRLHIDDPVSRYIPAFKSMQVNSGATTVPAAREITVRDLLTHTSGLAALGGGGQPPPPPPPGAAGPQRASPGGPPAAMMPGPEVLPTDTLASFAPKVAALPLAHQPGTVWGYSPGAGFDVLARVVEIVSGQTFRAYVTAHILNPLGMHDTTYGMPPASSRLLPVDPRFATDPRVLGTIYTSGSAGMFSTVGDYGHFAAMLADGGVYRGHRLLSAHSVTAMHTNHVGDLFPGMLGRGRVTGEGFGYGMAIVLDPAASGVHVPVGSYGWDGAGGTRFWVNPAQQSTMVVLGNTAAQMQLEPLVEAAFSR